MLGLAYGITQWQEALNLLLPAFLVLAAAVILQATWGMSRQFCRTPPTLAIGLVSTLVLVLFPNALTAILLLALNGIIGWLFLRKNIDTSIESEAVFIHQPTLLLAKLLIFLAIGLLFALPFLAQSDELWRLIDSFYRAGAMVWGGGHVVLPYLQLELVQSQQVDETSFVSGYAMAQALPGPMFSFAAYVGALNQGLLGALLSIIAIFLAGLLLVIGILPFYHALHQNPSVRAALIGLQATVVGLLFATLIHPILPLAVNTLFNGLLLLFNLLWLFYLKRSALALIPLNLIGLGINSLI
jgi:chromate transporter